MPLMTSYDSNTTITQSLQKWTEQFKALQGRHPGLWPVVPRITALVAIVLSVIAGGAWLSWIDQWEALAQAHIEEDRLRQLFRKKVGQAQNLEALRQQKNTVSARVDLLSRQLPSKSEMDALLSEINQAGTGRGLQFELFKPGQVQLQAHYAELLIEIRLSGNYQAFAGFVSDVANFPRVVTIDRLAINQQKDGVQIFDAVMHAYRYLDKEELSLQTKQASGKQKNKPPSYQQ
jgi:type IV pilus assembly protein PilO